MIQQKASQKMMNEKIVAHKATIAIEAAPQWFTVETDAAGKEYAVFYLRTGNEKGAGAIKIMDARQMTLTIIKAYAPVKSATGQTAAKAQQILERAAVDLPKAFRRSARLSFRETRKDGRYFKDIVLSDVGETNKEKPATHLLTAVWFNTDSHSHLSFGGDSGAQRQLMRRTKVDDNGIVRSVIVSITSEESPLWIDHTAVNPQNPDELTITTYQFKSDRNVFQKKAKILSEEILEGAAAGSILSTTDARSKQEEAEGSDDGHDEEIEESSEIITPSIDSSNSTPTTPPASLEQTPKSDAAKLAEELDEQFGEAPAVKKIVRKARAKSEGAKVRNQ